MSTDRNFRGIMLILKILILDAWMPDTLFLQQIMVL